MKTISHAKARQLAYAWHGGQSSPLYAFASSGIVQDIDALNNEIDNCRKLCHGLKQSDYVGLFQLQNYVKYKLKADSTDSNGKLAEWFFDRNIGFN